MSAMDNVSVITRLQNIYIPFIVIVIVLICLQNIFIDGRMYQRNLSKKKNKFTKLGGAIAFVISSMDWIVDRLHALERLHLGGNLKM